MKRKSLLWILLTVVVLAVAGPVLVILSAMFPHPNEAREQARAVRVVTEVLKDPAVAPCSIAPGPPAKQGDGARYEWKLRLKGTAGAGMARVSPEGNRIQELRTQGPGLRGPARTTQDAAITIAKDFANRHRGQLAGTGGQLEVLRVVADEGGAWSFWGEPAPNSRSAA